MCRPNHCALLLFNENIVELLFISPNIVFKNGGQAHIEITFPLNTALCKKKKYVFQNLILPNLSRRYLKSIFCSKSKIFPGAVEFLNDLKGIFFSSHLTV
jgi:hypothetical protein